MPTRKKFSLTGACEVYAPVQAKKIANKNIMNVACTGAWVHMHWFMFSRKRLHWFKQVLHRCKISSDFLKFQLHWFKIQCIDARYLRIFPDFVWTGSKFWSLECTSSKTSFSKFLLSSNVFLQKNLLEKHNQTLYWSYQIIFDLFFYFNQNQTRTYINLHSPLFWWWQKFTISKQN